MINCKKIATFLIYALDIAVLNNEETRIIIFYIGESLAIFYGRLPK